MNFQGLFEFFLDFSRCINIFWPKYQSRKSSSNPPVWLLNGIVQYRSDLRPKRTKCILINSIIIFWYMTLTIFVHGRLTNHLFFTSTNSIVWKATSYKYCWDNSELLGYVCYFMWIYKFLDWCSVPRECLTVWCWSWATSILS